PAPGHRLGAALRSRLKRLGIRPMRYAVLNAAFGALAAARLSPLIRALGQARGVIFTLHRVLPNPPAAFTPNSILQVTPEFLETALIETRRAGFDIVTMDEALDR